MTETATTTHLQTDLRKLPGDGKLNPVNHVVRIVVVRPTATSSARGGGDPHHGHGLTDGELADAEAMLKKKPAPPSPAGRRPTSSGDTEFDVLLPTDIVVVGREPASVRPIEGPDGKPGRRLFPHDDRHRDTVLRVWTESDTIEYQCDEPFEIAGVEKAGWKLYGTPDNPFANGELPYRADERPRATDGKAIWVWRSSVLSAKANNQQYKMSFRINGELVDPDVACGDPPPAP